jgi:Mn2+/Fe2+ NRAMP family transporter
MADGRKVIHLGEESIGKGNRPGGGVVTPRHLLAFGGWVLVGLAILMIAACAVYLNADKDHQATAKDIFELAKVTLPPIATLILGFYFRGSHGSE